MYIIQLTIPDLFLVLS